MLNKSKVNEKKQRLLTSYIANPLNHLKETTQFTFSRSSFLNTMKNITTPDESANSSNNFSIAEKSNENSSDIILLSNQKDKTSVIAEEESEEMELTNTGQEPGCFDNNEATNNKDIPSNN